MRSRLAVLAFAAMALIAATAPSAASAATEFGDTCAADEIGPSSYTLVTLASPETSFPLSAPVGGVITKVKLRTQEPLPISVPEVVKLLRPAGVDTFTVINQTAIQVAGSETVADARMPVQAGDKLGVYGPPFSIGESSIPGLIMFCDDVPGTLGAVAGDVPVGATATFPAATEGRVPLSAVIEPDADNDGFGDESQDGCPLSAAVQVPCPPINLDISAKAGKKAVVVLVTSATGGSVGVKGVVKLGKGKATLKAKAKTVVPGKLTSFRLKFNSKLKNRLKELEPSKKLTLKITASATNVAGQVSKDKSKVKLKGQA